MFSTLHFIFLNSSVSNRKKHKPKETPAAPGTTSKATRYLLSSELVASPASGASGSVRRSLLEPSGFIWRFLTPDMVWKPVGVEERGWLRNCWEWDHRTGSGSDWVHLSRIGPSVRSQVNKILSPNKQVSLPRVILLYSGCSWEHLTWVRLDV